MFESEVYSQIGKSDLPEKVISTFQETRNSVKQRSLLHWTEHCTECAMPSCFKTCDLYTARVDGKCARFVKGIEGLEALGLPRGSLIKISFKKWGVLATQGNHYLMDKADADDAEQHDLKTSRLIHKTPVPLLKKKLIQKRYSVKKNAVIDNLKKSEQAPQYFLFECYQPQNKMVDFQLTIRNQDPKYSKIPFQYKITLHQGYHKELIPFDEIEKRIRTELDYRIDLTPLNADQTDTFYFGMMEFVTMATSNQEQGGSSKIKCVVWDLDHTIWHGILTETGIEGLKLKEGIKDVLHWLDQRGIVNSIASKNDYEPAMEALEHFGLADFFIFPNISWKPKSQAIRNIAREININVNSLMFIDDSEFERNEVQSVFPQVTVLDAVEIDQVMGMKQLQSAATVEAKIRKSLYKNEEKRKQQADEFEGEYLEFLRSCKIKMKLSPLKEEYFDRVYELTQRTNQMNFSGNRYHEQDIADIAKDEVLDTYVMSCSDRFGTYGIVGFGIVDKKENQLIDLMFSCRIQSKRIEHAFIAYCLDKYLKLSDFKVRYKRTDRNKFSAQVFDDLNFEKTELKEDIHHLRFPIGKLYAHEEIVSVTE